MRKKSNPKAGFSQCSNCHKWQKYDSEYNKSGELIGNCVANEQKTGQKEACPNYRNVLKR